jgi:putative OPT family oligopeptide transporter
LPALLILNFWHEFNYWQTTFIAMIGGSLGVLFSIPLRRVLLADQTLRFPEGNAIGQVLKVSHQGGELNNLVKGGLLGSVISLFQSGFHLVASNAQIWLKINNQFVAGLGTGFEPALLAAGYIIGIRVAISTFVGILIGWIIGIPVLTFMNGFDITQDATDIAMQTYKHSVRYLGVGTMFIGGIWTLLMLIKPIIKGLHSSFASVHNSKSGP